MEKASIEPPEEEEERAVVNGNGVAGTPGQSADEMRSADSDGRGCGSDGGVRCCCRLAAEAAGSLANAVTGNGGGIDRVCSRLNVPSHD